ncbi:unnamed protein product [Vitrella brassicaformis CCMP3155]|uniref:Amine oxidase domain-containing protein n=2 Tax=Vitrella brassicaformis TaxID=1169539 RepID=A0A0G4F4L7_VITBC|nr:unnamed protein product [Vitrella brassicaformis CCMP3155]|eukprot:CEM06751.1 unnamed protein product [Vitrella brassicaformis CCMP3155]
MTLRMNRLQPAMTSFIFLLSSLLIFHLVSRTSAFLPPSPLRQQRQQQQHTRRRPPASPQSRLLSHRLSTVDVPRHSVKRPLDDDLREVDVVVVGSGIGGLSCAAMLARYGVKVLVLESHVEVGGAGHSWERDGFVFDSGPSLYSGLTIDPSPNPLKFVFDAIGEYPSWLTYDTWGVSIPGGSFDATIGPGPFWAILDRFGGPNAKQEWSRLMDYMQPLGEAAMAVPSPALRSDLGALLTLSPFFRELLKTIPKGPKLQGPFGKMLSEAGVTDPFILNWLNMLSFLLQGMPADGTVGAVMAYMLADWYRPNVKLDYPKGGSGAIAEALVRGIQKHGGHVLVNAHVEAITLDERGGAKGVRLRGGQTVRARRAVVSNASMWNTLKLLGENEGHANVRKFAERVGEYEQVPSFMHLHVGFDAKGLDPIQCHYAVCNDWSQPIDAPGNVIIISIPSVLDSRLAPDGHHVLHAYTAGNEPYELWADLKPTSPEYRQLKEERGDILWRAVERFIPDIKRRAKVAMVGTPKTHERYLRRDRGTYGPVLRAGEQTLPGAGTPIPRLLCCGDSVFPGIGVPAVAASGCIAAHSLVGVGQHYQMLQRVLKRGERTAEMDVTEYEPAAAAKATTPVGAK